MADKLPTIITKSQEKEKKKLEKWIEATVLLN